MKFGCSLLHAKNTKPGKTFKAKDAPEKSTILRSHKSEDWFIICQGDRGFTPYLDFSYSEAPEGTVLTFTQTNLEDQTFPF